MYLFLTPFTSHSHTLLQTMHELQSFLDSPVMVVTNDGRIIVVS